MSVYSQSMGQHKGSEDFCGDVEASEWPCPAAAARLEQGSAEAADSLLWGDLHLKKWGADADRTLKHRCGLGG